MLHVFWSDLVIADGIQKADLILGTGLCMLCVAPCVAFVGKGCMD